MRRMQNTWRACCRAYSTKPQAPQSAPSVPTAAKQNRDLILNVLRALPSQREARGYLKRFAPASADPVTSSPKSETKPVGYRGIAKEILSSHPIPDSRQRHLALVGLECHIPDAELAKFAATMVHLLKLGLMPIVVLMADTKSATVKLKKHPKMERDAMIRESFRVADAIEAGLGRAMPLYNSVFRLLEPTTSSLVEESAMIDTGVAISTIIDSKQVDGRLAVDLTAINIALSVAGIPVIVPMGGPSGSTTTLPSRQCLEALSLAFAADTTYQAPVKLVLANSRGGIMLRDGHPVGFINLAHEFREISNDAAEDSDVQNLDTVRSILNSLPSSSSAVIASVSSSAALIENLITDKPLAHAARGRALSRNAIRPPTVLRRGLEVELHTSLSTLDLPALSSLMDASFGKKLDADKYWHRIENIVGTVIVAGEYEGAAIVTHEHDPIYPDAPYIPYLDKFAVAPTSQGVGVADILWKSMLREYKDLSWRSRADNPVNKWYFERSDGNLRVPGGHWMLFWYGSEGVRRINSYNAMASAIPASFFPVPPKPPKDAKPIS
ncbi:amino-acid N-acetyltransferase [Synchytrium microbalum]|uniref:Amino-acid acetyltransferase, mitochondrial n=1 Tax=Synchytrium microbalum TaxID=1806994 RepID=A0A507C7E4_9FUNG|nr:amino-acid N-acetyltransferase [Synchytrium microbalum]TPX36967.1 amino-acid N-acetyltransferase [Synchytrium microbalum]